MPRLPLAAGPLRALCRSARPGCCSTPRVTGASGCLGSPTPAATSWPAAPPARRRCWPGSGTGRRASRGGACWRRSGGRCQSGGGWAKAGLLLAGASSEQVGALAVNTPAHCTAFPLLAGAAASRAGHGRRAGRRRWLGSSSTGRGSCGRRCSSRAAGSTSSSRTESGCSAAAAARSSAADAAAPHSSCQIKSITLSATEYATCGRGRGL